MSDYTKDFTRISAKKSYDPETALSLAVACHQAYKKKSEIEQAALKWGFPKPRFITVSKGKTIDTQCFVMADDKNVVVVFRGTSSIVDWLTDFRAVREPGPLTQKALAHEGFQDALFPAVIALTDAVDTFRTHDQKVWVTGHSLGGALCSLYAGMLLENKVPVYGIYTFASPRPGDSDFVDALDAAVPGPHYRVVNEGDIVPHVPPEPFFSHAGKRIILYKKKREQSKKAWKELRHKMFGELMDMTGRPWEIADNHVLDDPESGYLVRLKADLSRQKR